MIKRYFQFNSDEQIAFLLFKLDRIDKWGGNYAREENIRCASKEILKELVNRGWLIPHKNWNAFSLNLKLKKEIRQFIDEHLPK